ncbi:hypothetical protein ACFLSS_04140 [Bacteroidota bacterium]
MRQLFIVTIALLIGFSFVANAQMNLKLSNSFSHEQTTTLGNHNLESNMKLELPAEITIPPGGEFYKGLFFIGLMIDMTLPFGDDFKHVAGTGFSGHLFASYVIAKSILLSLNVGYIKFADNTSEDEFGNYEDSYSQIPILVGAYYLIATQSGFKPYIGLALGVFLATYSYKWTYEGYDPNTFQTGTITQEGDNSETKFGIVPTVGFYYFLAATTMLHVAIQYNIIFQELGESSSLSSLAILVGIAFALGGN